MPSQQALAGVGSMIQQGAALAPLFGKTPDTFDPTNATALEVQKVFNPTLESMQTTIDPSGRISPGLRVPTANFGIESVGFNIAQPGVTVNPFVIPPR